MVSIVDGGPLYRLVQVGEHSVQIFGIKFADLVPMLDRFPELRKAITPGRDTGELEGDFSFEGILKMGPKIMGAAIAAAMGQAGDATAEKWAMDLPIGVQVAMLKDIIELTVPKGLGLFVEDLRAMGLLGRAEPEEVSKPNGAAGHPASGARGKEAVMKSLQQSESSSSKTTTL